MWQCRCDDVDVTVDDADVTVDDVDVTVENVDVTVDDVEGQLTIARCNGRHALIARTRHRWSVEHMQTHGHVQAAVCTFGRAVLEEMLGETLCV